MIGLCEDGVTSANTRIELIVITSALYIFIITSVCQRVGTLRETAWRYVGLLG
jgi:hypothetical protein